MLKPFHFKQFTVKQDQCAMKVGTDGVLLGAWATLNHSPSSILDVGSGTGVIALQMAQRSLAESIDAIEIDENAHAQCVENFENSPWADRLFCYHASLQEYASEIDETYDLIVSNPPFFSEDYKTKSGSRDSARFNDALPFEHLIICAVRLLNDTGIFALILPYKETSDFIQTAERHGLFLKRICKVRGTAQAPIKRCLMEFSTHRSKSFTEESLTIETSRHNYTPEYKTLVGDFYLKM